MKENKFTKIVLACCGVLGIGSLAIWGLVTLMAVPDSTSAIVLHTDTEVTNQVSSTDGEQSLIVEANEAPQGLAEESKDDYSHVSGQSVESYALQSSNKAAMPTAKLLGNFSIASATVCDPSGELVVTFTNSGAAGGPYNIGLAVTLMGGATTTAQASGVVDPTMDVSFGSIANIDPTGTIAIGGVFDTAASTTCSIDPAGFSPVTATVPVLTCPAGTTMTNCATAAEIMAAYDALNMPGAATVTGGYAVIVTPSGPAPDRCTGGTVTFVYSVDVTCGSVSCTADLVVPAASPTAVTVDAGPTAASTPSECDAAAITAAYNALKTAMEDPTMYTITGGCADYTAVLTTDPGDPGDCAAGDYTLTATITDACSVTTTYSATLTIAPVTPLSITDGPASVTSTTCDAGTEFTNLVAAMSDVTAFTIDGGCAPYMAAVTSTGTPAMCSPTATYTVTTTITDACGSTATYDATFTIDGPDALTVTAGPMSVSVSECDDVTSTFDMLVAEMSDLTSFTVSGGCPPAAVTLTMPGMNPGQCSGATTTTITAEISDQCGVTVTYDATLTVIAASPLTVTDGPMSVSVSECDNVTATYDGLLAQMSAIGNFTIDGGCTPFAVTITAAGMNPGECSGATTTTITAEISDLCGTTTTYDATLTVTASTPLAIACPADLTYNGCGDAAAADAAFAAWVASYTVSGGCPTTMVTNTASAAAPAAGSSEVVSYTVTDDCGRMEQCSATFTTAPCTFEFNIADPCTCLNDAEVNADNGTFYEIVSIEGENNQNLPAGLMFTVKTISGGYSPSAVGIEEATVGVQGTPITAGTPLTYCPDGGGDCIVYNNPATGAMLTAPEGSYYLLFAHVDEEGYSISVEGPGAPGLAVNETLNISNTCFYPELQVTSSTEVCEADGPFVITGTPNATAGATPTFGGDATFTGGGLPPYSQAALAGLTDNGDGTATFDPAVAGEGCHVVSYMYMDAPPSPTDPGCFSIIEYTITVFPSDDASFTVAAGLCAGENLTAISLANALSTWPTCSTPTIADADRVTWYGGNAAAGVTVNDVGTMASVSTTNAATEGTYQICVDVGSGSCVSTYCQDFSVTNSLAINCPADFAVDADAAACNTTTVPPAPVVATCAATSTATYEVTGATTIAAGQAAGTPATLNVGLNAIIWSVVDANGNTATCNYTITVEDATAPTYTTVLANETVACTATVPAALDAAGLGASDNCTNLTVVVTDSDNGATNCPSDAVRVVTRTYTLTDDAGNVTQATQTFTFDEDTTPPTIAAMPAAVVNLTCGVDAVPAVTATDNCTADANITMSFSEVQLASTGTHCFSLLRTWTFTDGCGNATSATQTVNVTDTAAPTPSMDPADQTFCDETPTVPAVTFADNCDSSVDVDFNEVLVDDLDFNGYVAVRTWTGTDDCGNVASVSQTVTVYEAVSAALTTPVDVCVSPSAAYDLTNLFASTATTLGGTFALTSGAGTVAGDVLSYDPNMTLPASVTVTYTVGLGNPASACWDSQSATLNFIENDASFQVSTQTVCASTASIGNTIAITTTQADGTWTVQTGGGAVAGAGTSWTFTSDVAADGAYDICYTVPAVANACDTDQECVTIYVVADADPTIAAASACEGIYDLTGMFGATTTPGGTFMVDGAAVAGDSYDFQVASATDASQDFVVTYTATNENTCPESATATFTAVATPDASFTVAPSNFVCATGAADTDDDITITLAATPITGATVVVTVGGNAATMVSATEYTYNADDNWDGLYDIVVTITNTVGAVTCDDSQSTQIYVNKDVDATIADLSTCEQVINLTDMFVAGTTTPGGTFMVDGVAVAGNETSQADGTYTITYTVDSEGACVESATATLSVNNTYLVFFDIDQQCDQSPIDLSSQVSVIDLSTGQIVTPASATFTISAYNGTGVAGTIAGTTYTPDATTDGFVTIRYTAEDNGCVTIEEEVIEIRPAITFTLGACTCVADATRDVAISAIAGGLAPYTISATGGTLTATTGTSSTLNINDGEVSYSVTVTDARGCEVTMSGACAELMAEPEMINVQNAVCTDDPTFTVALNPATPADMTIINSTNNTWTVNGAAPGAGFTASGATLTVDPGQLTAATYTIRYIIDGDGVEELNCEDMVVMETFTVYESIDPTFTLPQTAICVTDGAFPLTSAGATQSIWVVTTPDGANTTLTSDASGNSSYDPAMVGLYTITHYTGEASCEQSYAVAFEVKPAVDADLDDQSICASESGNVDLHILFADAMTTDGGTFTIGAVTSTVPVTISQNGGILQYPFNVNALPIQVEVTYAVGDATCCSGSCTNDPADDCYGEDTAILTINNGPEIYLDIEDYEQCSDVADANGTVTANVLSLADYVSFPQLNITDLNCANTTVEVVAVNGSYDAAAFTPDYDQDGTPDFDFGALITCTAGSFNMSTMAGADNPTMNLSRVPKETILTIRITYDDGTCIAISEDNILVKPYGFPELIMPTDPICFPDGGLINPAEFFARTGTGAISGTPCGSFLINCDVADVNGTSITIDPATGLYPDYCVPVGATKIWVEYTVGNADCGVNTANTVVDLCGPFIGFGSVAGTPVCDSEGPVNLEGVGYGDFAATTSYGCVPQDVTVTAGGTWYGPFATDQTAGATATAAELAAIQAGTAITDPNNVDIDAANGATQYFYYVLNGNGACACPADVSELSIAVTAGDATVEACLEFGATLADGYCSDGTAGALGTDLLKTVEPVNVVTSTTMMGAVSCGAPANPIDPSAAIAALCGSGAAGVACPTNDITMTFPACEFGTNTVVKPGWKLVLEYVESTATCDEATNTLDAAAVDYLQGDHDGFELSVNGTVFLTAGNSQCPNYDNTTGNFIGEVTEGNSGCDGTMVATASSDNHFKLEISDKEIYEYLGGGDAAAGYEAFVNILRGGTGAALSLFDVAFRAEEDNYSIGLSLDGFVAIDYKEETLPYYAAWITDYCANPTTVPAFPTADIAGADLGFTVDEVCNGAVDAATPTFATTDAVFTVTPVASANDATCPAFEVRVDLDQLVSPECIPGTNDAIAAGCYTFEICHQIEVCTSTCAGTMPTSCRKVSVSRQVEIVEGNDNPLALGCIDNGKINFTGDDLTCLAEITTTTCATGTWVADAPYDDYLITDGSGNYVLLPGVADQFPATQKIMDIPVRYVVEACEPCTDQEVSRVIRINRTPTVELDVDASPGICENQTSTLTLPADCQFPDCTYSLTLTNASTYTLISGAAANLPDKCDASGMPVAGSAPVFANGVSYANGVVTIDWSEVDVITEPLYGNFVLELTVYCGIASNFCSASDTQDLLFLGETSSLLMDVTDECGEDYNLTGMFVAANTAGGGTFSVDGTAIPGNEWDFAQGTYVITYTVDINGACTTASTATLTIDDTTAPTFDNCPDPGFVTDVFTNSCVAGANWSIPVASDNCDGVTVAQTAGPAQGSQIALGMHTVTYTATDIGGNTAICSFVINVIDTENPVVNCPADVVAGTDAGNCSAVVNGINVDATDCTTVTVSYAITGATSATGSGDASGTTFALGNSVVTYTATDNDGNSASCNFTVTVEDTEAPTITCASNFTRDADADCDWTMLSTGLDATAGDNCGVASLTHDYNGGGTTLQNATFPLGTTVVVWTATDAAGNSTACTVSVTVEDNTAPAVACAGAQTVSLDANCEFIVPDYTNNGNATASDNCELASVVQSPAPGSAITAVTTTTITVTATDASGNTNTCTIAVTTEDNLAPVALCKDITIALDANGAATTTAAAVDNGSYDNCASTVSVSINNGSFGCADLGNQVVILTADDGNGNTDQCMANVLVVDTTNPMIACPTAATVTLSATGSHTFDVGDFAGLTATDNCSVGAYSFSPATVYCEDAETNVNVVITVTDGSGNTDNCTVVVTVDDNTAPPADVCNDITVQLDAAGAASISTDDVAGIVDDECGQITLVSVAPNAFGCANVGANTATLTYNDGNGNTTTCTSIVTVEDNVAPAVDCEASVTVTLDAAGAGSITTADVQTGAASDACGIASESLSQTAFTCADLGLNAEQLTVTDNNNNVTTCDVVVEVVDATAPSIVCPGPIVLASCDDAIPAIAVTATDACDASPSIAQNPGAGALASGSLTVTVTATDASGNAASCTVDVTITDTTAPIAECIAPLTVSLDDDGIIEIADASSIDNGSTDDCGAITMSIDNSLFDCSNIGDNTVTLTVTDAAGNASTCTTTVTVLDTTAPDAVCQDVTVALDAAGAASITTADIDAGSSDACGVTSTTISASTFGCADLGDNNVTLTVTDNNGNVSICVATVTVVDNTVPTIACPASPFVRDADDNCEFVMGSTGLDATGADNCGNVTLTHDHNGGGATLQGATFSLGTTYVTWTATDAAGNVAHCLVQVEVEDNTDPVITCPGDQTITGNVNCEAVLVDYTAVGATDNCGTPTVSQIALDSNGNTIEPGQTFSGTANIVLSSTDSAGNTAECTFAVTVDDGTPPIALCKDVTVELDANGAATVAAADVNNGSFDNCGNVTISIPATTYGCADAGNNQVVLTVSDGTLSTSCTANVLVEDNIAPTFTCPDPQTIASCNDAIPDIAGMVMDAADNCGIASITQNPVAGEDLPPANGNSIDVTVTVVDNNGNVADCTVSVTITDSTDPYFENCPTTVVTVGNDVDECSAIVNWSIPVAYDDCVEKTVTQVAGPAPGTSVDVNAVETVTYEATDSNGNTFTCSFDVTVVDTQDPEFNVDIILPGDATYECDNPLTAAGTDVLGLTLADVNDNCGVASVVFNEVSTQGTDNTMCDFYTYEITRTWTITDVNDNTEVHEQLIDVEDTTAPVAVCQDITVTLDNTGNASITPADINNGSSDNCAPASVLGYALDITDFDCGDVGTPVVVELTVTDPCTNAGTCNATVTVVEGAVPCDPDYDFDGSDPCVCLNNATTLDDGQFGEFIQITAPAGDMFTVTAVQGLYTTTSPAPPAAPTPIALGTALVNGLVDGIDNDNDGSTDEADESIYYTLDGRHIDGQGYSLTATGANFGSTITLANTCFYPTPEFIDLPTEFCLGTETEVNVEDMFGSAGTFVVFIDGVQVDPPVINGAALGLGEHEVVAVFDAGAAAGYTLVNGVVTPQSVASLDDARADAGCESTIEITINVVETPTQVACNDLVNISIDDIAINCQVEITPDMVLEGSYGCFDDYDVVLTYPLGTTTYNGPIIDQTHVGHNVPYTLVHPISGNSCWGTLVIEDKLAPVIACPADVTLLCTENPDELNTLIFNQLTDEFGVLLTGEPTIVQECSDATRTYSDNVSDFDCAANPEFAHIIQRTFTVTDEYGNVGQCVQNIYIRRAEFSDVVVPNDVDIDCNDPAFADGDYSPEAIEARLPDDLPFIDPCIAGNGWPELGCENLTTAGSGDVCGLGISYVDEMVNICEGTSFKIVRTWTLFDWCPANGGSGVELDYVQTIKINNVAPTITVQGLQNANGEFEIGAYNPAGSPLPVCSTSGPFPVASVEGNCDELVSVTLQVSNVGDVDVTPAPGSNLTQAGIIDGNLPLGGPYDVTYIATDACGTTSQVTIQVMVIDNISPVAICDEITTVSVSSDGNVVVPAETFDDGSHDNCCLDGFLVKRMGQPDSAFGPSETFTCSDIPGPVMVVFRAVDCFDNANDCMVEVLVEDQVAPIVACPNPASITCDVYFDNYESALGLEDYSVLDDFGSVTIIDNCDPITTPNVNVNIDQCGEGTITRSWSVTDPSGNGPSTCSQTITVTHVSDWAVMFPDDVFVECEEDQPDFGEPELYFETCELLAVSHSDLIFTTVPDACYKIARQWTVINWCTVGDEIDEEVVELPESAYPFIPNSNPIQIDFNGNGRQIGFNNPLDNPPFIVGHSERTFRENRGVLNATDPAASDEQANVDFFGNPIQDGYITYEQTIFVVDEVDPVIVDCTIPNVCIYDDCTIDVTLPTPDDVMDCSPDVVVTVESTNLGIGSGFGPYINVAPGTYEVIYKATDNCGNWSVCESSITVEDCKNPTPYCEDGLVINIMNTTPAMVDVWASDFDAGSFDNCGVKCVAFSADCTDTQRVYDCSQLGEQPVQLWVQDIYDNWDFCETFVVIQDNSGACDPGNLVVEGTIETEELEGVGQVEVGLNGAMNSMFTTSDDGTYNFNNLPVNGDYTVTPMKDINPTNGVSTFDLVLITKHVLGVDLLDSPYKIIAADANNSGSVSTFDMVVLRKLILMIDENFANNTSWRFVDASYEFPEPMNPWAEVFPEVLSFNNLDASITDADFVGIKVGDVNGSAQANNLLGTDDRNTVGELVFAIADTKVKAGEQYTVDFTAKDFEANGYQFTLNFDNSVLDFVELIPAIAGEENFGFTLLDEGAITTSWNAEDVRLDDGAVVFSLVFNADSDAQLSDLLSVSSRYTAAEAYNNDGELLDVNLEFNGILADAQFELFQNVPNPFSDGTIIGFNLPEATSAVLTITDASGRVLKVIDAEYGKGYNQVSIDRDQLSATGVLYYNLETATDSATKKMVFLKR